MVTTTRTNGIRTVALATTNQMDTGIRAVSAVLKSKYRVIKLKLYEDGRHGATTNYSEKEIQSIARKLSELDVDLLGISLFGYGAERGFRLLQAVKRELGIPVIIGGQYAMQWPDECLAKGADAVCLSESERGLVELLDNWDSRLVRDNSNFVVRKEDLPRRFQLQAGLPPEIELDEITPDFHDEDYYVLTSEQMVPMIAEEMANPRHHQTDRVLRTYIYASDRGCPFNCTFCHVLDIRNLVRSAREAQGGDHINLLRRKSPAAMVRDMVAIKELNPWVQHLTLMNDDTAARTVGEMEEFSQLYRRHIGWPFYCMVSPMSLYSKKYEGTPEAVVAGRAKVQALVEAGLTELNAGIQTNGESNRKYYNRVQPDQALFAVTDMLQEFASTGAIGLFYDFITFNPLESANETRKTYELIKRLKPPFDLVSHTLHIDQRTVMRMQYEQYKAEAIAAGRPYNKVHEDMVGESDYHDTHLFVDYLADNPKFILDATMEFLAGRHSLQMTGRIPRFARDLLDFDVFKELRLKHSGFAHVLENVEIPSDMMSLDLLICEQVEGYFRENRSVFKELYLTMHDRHPIHYSNMRKTW
jgi:hypothetical protein